MITITLAAGTPKLSTVEGSVREAWVQRSVLGDAVADELRIMCEKYPELSIYKSVVMPDHIHFVLNVSRCTSYHVGTAIGWFMGACTRRYRVLIGREDVSLFKRGFHDRILMRAGQLHTMIRYVADNPRRFLVRREHPDLFMRRVLITIDGHRFEALGNIFLLRNPLIDQVRISSKYTPDELSAHVAVWQRNIEEGGVLVSPFISAAERAFRTLAIEHGSNIIDLIDNGFGPRYKPSGQNFELCAQGRLLLIAPLEHATAANSMTRKKAMFLNDMAAKIAGLEFEFTVSGL